MRTRDVGPLMLLAVATSAGAQPSATFNWHWQNMATGDQTPLSPGDAAAIWVDVEFTPPIGAVVLPGLINRGMASMFLDLHAVSDVFGTWVVTGTAPAPFPGTPEIDGPGTNVPMGWQPGDPVRPLHWGRRTDPSRPGMAWSIGSDAHYQPLGGAVNSPGTLAAVMAGQFPTGAEINEANPIHEIWRGMFTPDSYAARDLVWQPRTGSAGSTGAVVTLLVEQVGGGPFTTVAIGSQNIGWGALSIPVVPGPSALAVFGIAGVLLSRPRRVHGADGQ